MKFTTYIKNKSGQTTPPRVSAKIQNQKDLAMRRVLRKTSILSVFAVFTLGACAGHVIVYDMTCEEGSLEIHNDEALSYKGESYSVTNVYYGDKGDPVILEFEKEGETYVINYYRANYYPKSNNDNQNSPNPAAIVFKKNNPQGEQDICYSIFNPRPD